MYQAFFFLLAYRPRPEPEPRTALAGLGPGLGLEISQAWALESQAKATASRPSRAVTSLIYLYSSEHCPLETVFPLVSYCMWVMHQPTHIRRLSHLLVGFLRLEFFFCSSEHCTLEFVFPLRPSTQKYKSFQLLLFIPRIARAAGSYITWIDKTLNIDIRKIDPPPDGVQGLIGRCRGKLICDHCLMPNSEIKTELI